MPEPGAMRRCAVADQCERLARLLQRLARAAQIPECLRGPGERAREALGVARTPQLSRRVAIVRERSFVVAAHAMEKPAQEDDPGQPPFGAWWKPIEPALQSRDLAALKRPLSVVAHELRRASVISRLLEVMDRPVDVAACRGAFGVPAMQLDDLGGGKELSRPRAEEFGEERLESVAALCAFARDQARLLERGEKLARSAARSHRLVVVDALEEGPAEDHVLVAARPTTEDLAVEVGVELGSATLELAELLPTALGHERGREPQSGGPAAGAGIHRVDGLLGELETELAA